VVIAAAWLLLAVAPAEARSKTDVVVVDTGDSITCEIKKLERGLLKVSTDYMSTVYIEWQHVEQLSSTQAFQLEMEDGQRYFGPIEPASQARKMTIPTATDTVTLDHPDVVRITAIDEKFADRMTGSIDLGVTAKNAQSERSFTLGATARYRSRKYLLKGDLDSDYSRRDDVSTIERYDVSAEYQRFRKNRWFVVGYTQLESNSELDLDLRAMLGGGGGRYLVQSNRSLFAVTAGLAANREIYSSVEDDSEETNLEGVLRADYQLFTFSDLSTDFTISLAILPGITDWGRVRTNFGSNLSKELINDFYISFNLTATYDTRPPTEGEKGDWTTWVSLGYSF
jgi:putative salt-induced outer membrane protein YdiY